MVSFTVSDVFDYVVICELCPGGLFDAVHQPNNRQARVHELKRRREDAATKISAVARGRIDRRRTSEVRHDNDAAILIQKAARGHQGRTHAHMCAQQQDETRREEDAAIKIQKLARGNSERRLHHQSEHIHDFDRNGVKSDSREHETGAGVACLHNMEDGAAPAEPRLEDNGSPPENVGPKRVGFLTDPCAREEVASQLALDLDERIKSFVAVQATVRRYEAKVEAAAIRRASAGSESSGKDEGRENGMEIHDDIHASKEREDETEPGQEMSESDLVIGSSLSGSLEQDTSGMEDREEEVWKSDFVLDESSEGTLAHENIVEFPQSGTGEGLDNNKADLALDGGSEGTHALLEEVKRKTGEQHERDSAEGLGGVKCDLRADDESESAVTNDTKNLETDGNEEHESEEPQSPEGEEEKWKSDFAVDVLEVPGFEEIELKSAEEQQSVTTSGADKVR